MEKILKFKLKIQASTFIARFPNECLDGKKLPMLICRSKSSLKLSFRNTLNMNNARTGKSSVSVRTRQMLGKPSLTVLVTIKSDLISSLNRWLAAAGDTALSGTVLNGCPSQRLKRSPLLIEQCKWNPRRIFSARKNEENLDVCSVFHFMMALGKASECSYVSLDLNVRVHTFKSLSILKPICSFPHPPPGHWLQSIETKNTQLCLKELCELFLYFEWHDPYFKH